eukprot:390968-Pelagomonas_calceolata.AAC.1
MNVYFDGARWCVVVKYNVLETAQRISGQECLAQPRLASLSPEKALSLGSLPHDTQSRGAVPSGENPAMRGQHMQGQQLLCWAAAAAVVVPGEGENHSSGAVERSIRVPKQPCRQQW